MAILAACEHLRDRFLLSLLAETGMRVGQALGLRHADFVSRKREVHIVPRGWNANGARAKSGARTVPVGPELVRLYADYLHEEYGGIDLLTELPGLSSQFSGRGPGWWRYGPGP